MPRPERVDIFDRSLAVLEVRVLQQSHQLAVIAGVDFAIYQ